MRRFVGCGLVITVVFAASTLVAQDSGFFSGNGFKDNWPASTSDETGSKSGSSIFGFNQNSKVDRPTDSGFHLPKFQMPKMKAPEWEMPKLFQKKSYPKPVQMTDSHDDGMMSKFPGMDLWTKRDSSQPNFFQRMNNRTKDAVHWTRDGFSNLGERSRNTWDSITRGVGGGTAKSHDSMSAPVQPDLRSAKKTPGSMNKF